MQLAVVGFWLIPNTNRALGDPNKQYDVIKRHLVATIVCHYASVHNPFWAWSFGAGDVAYLAANSTNDGTLAVYLMESPGLLRSWFAVICRCIFDW